MIQLRVFNAEVTRHGNRVIPLLSIAESMLKKVSTIILLPTCNEVLLTKPQQRLTLPSPPVYLVAPTIATANEANPKEALTIPAIFDHLSKPFIDCGAPFGFKGVCADGSSFWYFTL